MFCVDKSKVLFFLALIFTTLQPSISPKADDATNTTGKAKKQLSESEALDNNEEMINRILAEPLCEKTSNAQDKELCQETIAFARNLKSDIAAIKNGTKSAESLDYKGTIMGIINKALSAHTPAADAPANTNDAQVTENGTKSSRSAKMKTKFLSLFEKIDKAEKEGKKEVIKKNEALKFLNEMKAVFENEGETPGVAPSRSKRGVKSILGWAAASSGLITFVCLVTLVVPCVIAAVSITIAVVLVLLVAGISSPVWLVILHKNGGIRDNIRELFH
ncbi:hypothetical protein DdX_17106 [Ditylenchus destructor]|uniref:Uncharacterized protein n=1 Tax=Ditylenchus destructor TaxID=166010 RepID=A0AAD4MPL9_9BILA|nr:hypothetical protein DdX_17106 [Ditylenchus destructor]